MTQAVTWGAGLKRVPNYAERKKMKMIIETLQKYVCFLRIYMFLFKKIFSSEGKRSNVHFKNKFV